MSKGRLIETDYCGEEFAKTAWEQYDLNRQLAQFIDRLLTNSSKEIFI